MRLTSPISTWHILLSQHGCSATLLRRASSRALPWAVCLHDPVRVWLSSPGPQSSPLLSGWERSHLLPKQVTRVLFKLTWLIVSVSGRAEGELGPRLTLLLLMWPTFGFPVTPPSWCFLLSSSRLCNPNTLCVCWEKLAQQYAPTTSSRLLLTPGKFRVVPTSTLKEFLL